MIQFNLWNKPVIKMETFMKLTLEQYQQIINSISDKTVDLSFIREAEI